VILGIPLTWSTAGWLLALLALGMVSLLIWNRIIR
jgi:hypothetical protein